MKTPLGFFALALLLASCGKEESKTASAEAKKTAAVAAPKPPAEKKPAPVAPQGKLPQMDPGKARFIAVPNTPKDKEAELKKAAPQVQESSAGIPQEPEVKKAEVK